MPFARGGFGAQGNNGTLPSLALFLTVMNATPLSASVEIINMHPIYEISEALFAQQEISFRLFWTIERLRRKIGNRITEKSWAVIRLLEGSNYFVAIRKGRE